MNELFLAEYEIWSLKSCGKGELDTTMREEPQAALQIHYQSQQNTQHRSSPMIRKILNNPLKPAQLS
jgi:hypothetical protein